MILQGFSSRATRQTAAYDASLVSSDLDEGEPKRTSKLSPIRRTSSEGLEPKWSYSVGWARSSRPLKATSASSDLAIWARRGCRRAPSKDSEGSAHKK